MLKFNKKRRKLNDGGMQMLKFCIEYLAKWFCLVSIGGFFASAFELSFYRIPAFVVAFLSLVIVDIYISKIQVKRNRILSALWFGLALIGFLVFASGASGGLYCLLNDCINAIGQKYPYILIAFPRHGSKISATFFILWLEIFIVPAIIIFAEKKKKMMAVIVAILVLVLQALGLKASLFCNLMVYIAFVSIWIEGRHSSSEGEPFKISMISPYVCLACIGVVLIAVTQLFMPISGYQKSNRVIDFRQNFFDTVLDFNYGGRNNPMPEGKLVGLSSFEPEEDTALEVTMNKPQSYYFRGFTGSEYKGDRWMRLSSEKCWKGRDLFYWLHESGFYGQQQLALAGKTLTDDVTQKGEEKITIKNISGSSKYIYAPYELSSTPEGDGRLGDESIVSSGIRGSREYSYRALPNQVTRYAQIASELINESALNKEALEYKEKEGYYNQYIYENYLDIPDVLKVELAQLLGEYSIEEGEMHANYVEAKQNISYLLTSGYKYSEQLDEPWRGGDFIADFLLFNKVGYSVHFASAATMMFRYYGIPARYVEGYIVTPDDVKNMRSGKPYKIDDTHAHSWTEYYQDGVGWIPFEVTPAYMGVMESVDDYQDISGVSTGAESETNENKDDKKEETENDITAMNWTHIFELILYIGILLLLLLIIAMICRVIYQRRCATKARLMFYDDDYNFAVRNIFNYSMNILNVIGMPFGGVSLNDYNNYIEEVFGEEGLSLYKEAVKIRQEAVYSTHILSKDDRDKMLDFKNFIWKKVYDESGILQKLRLKYIYLL